MARASEVLFLCLIGSVAIAALSLSFYDLYLGYVYELQRDVFRSLQDLRQLEYVFKKPAEFYLAYSNQSFVRGFCNLLLEPILTTAFVVFWRKFMRRLGSPIFSNLLQDVRETSPKLTVLWCFSLYCTFLLLTLSWLVDGWQFGLRDLAYIADGLGAYETGEQIFSLTRDEHGCSLASTCGMNGHDSDFEEIKSGRLNRAVARIYGSDSVEMAQRQSVLSNHLHSNFYDLVSSEIAGKQSIAIYSRLGKLTAQAKGLAFVAVTQVELHKYDDARRSVEQALNLVSHATVSEHYRADVQGLVYAPLWAMGDKQRCNQLLTQMESSNNPVKSNDFDFVDCLLALAAAQIVAIGPLLTLLGMRWTSQVNLASDREKAYWLNKLINLELVRRKYYKADEHSKELLRLAEAN